MTTLESTASRVTGGAWLLEDTAPGSVFTPERLSDEHRLIDQTAAEFVANEIAPNHDRLETKDWDLARRLVQHAGGLGLLGTDVPEAYGGLALDKASTVVVGTRIGHSGSFGSTFGAHTGLAILPLHCFGTPAQKEKYLGRLVSGEWVGAYCLSESGSGSDALGAKARADPECRRRLLADRREDVDHQRRVRGSLHRLRQGGWRAVHRVPGGAVLARRDERQGRAQDGPARLVHHPGHPAGRPRARRRTCWARSARGTRWRSTR